MFLKLVVSFFCVYVAKGVCVPGEWKCMNNECILESERCDGLLQCVDESDEIGCGNYKMLYKSYKSFLITFFFAYTPIYTATITHL